MPFTVGDSEPELTENRREQEICRNLEGWRTDTGDPGSVPIIVSIVD